MQTFLPYSDFYKSLDCLDLKRLNKQHVESYQIINTIENGGYWKNHPAVRMWSKNINALKEYFNINKQMCLDKGIKSNKLDFYDIKDNVVYPDWLGWKLFHISMRSNLLLKDYNFYSKIWMERIWYKRVFLACYT